MRIVSNLGPAAIAIASALSAPAVPAQPLIEAGWDREEITPDGPIRLHGYALRSSPSVGVDQPIWARALAIGSDEQGPCVLVAVDSLGVSDAIVEELAARLKRRAGLARANLVVAATHTHSAPLLEGVAPSIFGADLPADQAAAVRAYTARFINVLERVALAALESRRPLAVSWGRGTAQFAANRRTPGGPVDHDLPVLKVAEPGPKGGLVAVVVAYACHCTTLDPAANTVGGDWAGDAAAAIEADHPGSSALVLIGCGADANPVDRPGREVARRHGRSIADEVTRLVAGPLRPLSNPPTPRLTRVALPFDTLPTPNQLRATAEAGGAAGYTARKWLDALEAGGRLPVAVDYPIQSWCFGDDLAIVFLAGEVVVDYSLRLKRELDADRLWVVAYANDSPGYIPSERILTEGGYEGGGAMVYYGQPTRFRPGLEDALVAAVRSIVPPAYSPSPVR